MTKLIKLHYKYLFSRFNIITIGVILTVLVLGIVLISQPFKSRSDHFLNSISYKEIYFENTLILIKMAFIILSSLIMGNSFTTKNDNYNTLYLSYYPSRITYFVSKLITVQVFLILLCGIVYGCYLIIGYSLTPWFIWNFYETWAFLALMLIGLVYGTLTVFLVLIIDSFLVVILPFFSFIVSELIGDFGSASTISLFNVFLPVLHTHQNKPFLIYGLNHLLILLVFYGFLGIIIYTNKDFY